MIIQYVSRTLLTTVLPKRIVKSLRYTTILCLLMIHDFFLENKNTDSGKTSNKKANISTKMTKQRQKKQKSAVFASIQKSKN